MLSIYKGAHSALGMAFVFILVAGCATTGSHIELTNTLPPSDIGDGWHATDPVAVFDTETIFNHIDGESELFFPYGFRGAAYVSYANEQYADVTIEADVYEMGSSLDAFGVYSNFRYPDADLITLGCEGFISDQQLMFYSDVYFVKLTVVGSLRDGRNALEVCADSIRRRLPKSSQPPKELELVAVDGVIPETEMYIADSLLGYEFFPKGFVAKAGTEEAPDRIFVSIFDDSAGAAEALHAYRAYLEKNGASISDTTAGATPCQAAMDPLYKGVAFAQCGPYVYGVIGYADTAYVPAIFEALASHLNS